MPPPCASEFPLPSSTPAFDQSIARDEARMLSHATALIVKRAGTTELSESPDLLPIALIVVVDETVIPVEYVVPCVQVPEPFVVGVLPSVVKQSVAPLVEVASEMI
jgi:hypothetical protein